MTTITTLIRQPQRQQVIPLKDGFMCSVALIYRRGYLERGYEVSLMGKSALVSLRPVIGERRRDPQRFSAVVCNSDGTNWRTLELRANQMLMVLP